MNSLEPSFSVYCGSPTAVVSCLSSSGVKMLRDVSDYLFIIPYDEEHVATCTVGAVEGFVRVGTYVGWNMTKGYSLLVSNHILPQSSGWAASAGVAAVGGEADVPNPQTPRSERRRAHGILDAFLQVGRRSFTSASR